MSGEDTVQAGGEAGGTVQADAGGYGRELAALDLLGTATSTALSLTTVLDTALASTAELLALHVGLIELWDPVQHCLRVAAMRLPDGSSPQVDSSTSEAELQQTLAGRVFTQRTPLFTSNVRAEQAYPGTPAATYGAVSVAAVPLIARDQPLGVLIAANESTRAFSSADRHLMLTIGRQVAAAIANARLFEEATRRAEEMRLLVELGQRLNAILDQDSLLKAIVTEVQSALQCRLVAVGLLEGERWRVAAAAEPGGLAEPPLDTTIGRDVGLCGWVTRHREPVCVPDVDKDARYYCPPSWQGIGIRSEAVVPIQLGDELLGVLDVESEQPAAFDDQDVAVLQTVANQAAVAIGNARIYAQSELRAKTLRALLSTIQELNSTLDLRPVLQVIVREACALIEVDACTIFLLNPESGILTPVVAQHDYADQVMGMTLKLGQGITGHVALTGVAEIVNHAEQDPRAYSVPGTPADPEAILAAPLRYQGKVIGVMTLSRLGEHLFSPADLELLGTFASQAAVAVENARLYTDSGRHARQLEQAHARLLRTQDQLLQAEKLSAIGQLAAGVAHEVNNPLTAIMGFAQLLQGENLSAAGRADLRRILAAVERAQKIVANLLAFARQQRTAPQMVDLAALIERTVRLHAAEFGTGGVQVRQELEDLPEVRVEPAQIEQLVVHLLRHAYRATSQAGGGTLTVRLSQHGRGLVRLEVADEGPGIEADMLPHIFDPFYSADEIGEGLSLAACFGIVRAHKGRIWAESPAEGGTRFVVELPLDAERAQGAEPVPGGSSVLIVTGDEALAGELLSILAEMGHHPSRVESGEAALAEIVVQRYDLILCDVSLPGMGIERLYESAGANDPGLAFRFVVLGTPEPALGGLPTLKLPIDDLEVREVVGACLGESSPRAGEA